MNLKELNREQLLNLYLTTQGDLTVPPHMRDNPNRELTKRCFVELLRRSPSVKGGLNGVKR
jgi:hypothetical protein